MSAFIHSVLLARGQVCWVIFIVVNWPLLDKYTELAIVDMVVESRGMIEVDMIVEGRGIEVDKVVGVLVVGGRGMIEDSGNEVVVRFVK